MKVHKPITIELPTLLVQNLVTYLKAQGIESELEKCYFLFSHILRQTIKNKHRFDETNIKLIALNKKMLQTVCGNRIDFIKKNLINGEFIICDEKYFQGKKPKWYGIHRRYLNGPYCKVEITLTSPIFLKIIKELNLQKAHQNRLYDKSPHLKKMHEYFMKIELDEAETKNFIDRQLNEENKLIYLNSISQIMDKRFRYFKRNKTNNRLDTNFTNLKKELRQFFIGDFVQIDLKNAQPFFLSILIDLIIQDHNSNKRISLCSDFSLLNISKAFGIKAIKQILKIHQNKKNSLTGELMEFKKIVTNGNFYEYFMDDLNLNRADVKKTMYAVFFSQNKKGNATPYKNEKAIFVNKFPLLFEIIECFKDKDHTQFSIMLQKMESFTFIDSIAKELVYNSIIPITIHDSIIIEIKHKEASIKIIKDLFLNYFDTIPSFEIESLRK